MTTSTRQIQCFGKPPVQSAGVQQQKRRPGGGWGDDTEDFKLKNVGNTYGDNKTKNQDNQSPVKPKAETQLLSPSQQKNLSSMQLKVEECNEEFLQSHQYENKIINEIIQPGGARVKQPDSALLEFCNTSEHLEPSIVGSILLSKFNEQIGWIPKARVIFAIEALSKKFSRYFDYFKYNIAVLQKAVFNAEGPNANQLRKFMDSLMYILNHPAYSAELQKENQFFTSKPSGPTIPHNNSQGESSKQKAGQLFAAKSSSLPSTQTQKETTNCNFVNLETVKEPEQKNAELMNTQLLDLETPVPNNLTTNPKIPLDKTNDIANCLSDIDFSADKTKSPNSIYNLYQGPSTMNYYGAASPTGFVGGYSPAYYNNYPANNNNNQMQGGFNSYVQANAAQYQNNNNNFDQYDLFNQPTEIDYNQEETEKQKKRQEIEKRFESLNF